MKPHLNRNSHLLLALLLLAQVGCAGAPYQEVGSQGSVAVAITLDSNSIAVGETVAATVKAKNQTGASLSYGRGSSSCSLFAQVRLGNEDYDLVIDRACLRDLVVWTLAPGEERVERWSWSGKYFDHEWDGETYRNTARLNLPAGEYEIRGVAGQFVGLATTIKISE